MAALVIASGIGVVVIGGSLLIDNLVDADVVGVGLCSLQKAISSNCTWATTRIRILPPSSSNLEDRAPLNLGQGRPKRVKWAKNS